MPPTPDLSFTCLDEFVNKLVVENSKAMSSEEVPKEVRKCNDAPIIEDWVSDSEEENVSQTKTEKKIVKPSIAKIEFVKPKQQEKTARKTVKQVEKHRQNTHSPRGNLQIDLQDQGVIDSRCSRHITWNMSYLINYEEINRGYFAFGGNPKGWKIIGKCTIKTEAVNTACYVQNRVLVVKPHNKTSYELFHGFIKVSSLLELLNSKAFRVFNSRTRIVEENLHIRFSESTSNVIGSEPDWLFDIDALTRTMNYEPIVAGTQSNDFVGPKSSQDDGSKPSSDDGKKFDEDPRKESESNDQEKEDNVNSTNNANLLAQMKLILW
ncbi:hypothetical protein Tco_0571346 [Tanacetum coccineum]